MELDPLQETSNLKAATGGGESLGLKMHIIKKITALSLKRWSICMPLMRRHWLKIFIEDGDDNMYLFSKKGIQKPLSALVISVLFLLLLSQIANAVTGQVTELVGGAVSYSCYSEAVFSWAPSTNEDIVHGYGHVETKGGVFVPTGYMGAKGYVYRYLGGNQYQMLAESDMYFNPYSAKKVSQSDIVVVTSGWNYCGQGYVEVYDPNTTQFNCALLTKTTPITA